ncbi:MAG: xanthine dehydrogenase family protein molybdopterin-binding subunit [Deltaproteobacteria bacterium]|nr:xanthine dehydrogenase family protein molybdopterin-binding subunit [Deltaproteobacteria bacterium]
MRIDWSRREFLQTSLSGGLTVAFASTGLGFRLFSSAEAATEFSPSVWLRVAPDGVVTIYCNKSEMGQGILTTSAMIVADELGADWKKVRVEEAPAADAYKDPVWGFQGTGGSTSVRHMEAPLRKAGAAAREMLVAAAAREWGVAAAECRAADGTVVHSPSHRMATYGALAEKAARLPVPETPSLKEPGELRLMGTPVARLDLPAKVAGTAAFGIDTFRPEQLYGAVARPPAFGAKPSSFDREAATKVKGVRQVVEIPQGIGVCADTPSAAWKGRDALAKTWSGAELPTLDTRAVEARFGESLTKSGVVARNDGDVETALAKAARRVDATYALPYLAHFTMEPMNCTAHVQTDRCDVWAPTQNQSGVHALAQKISGLPPEKVFVHTTYLGCGFGRRFETDFVAEALELSKKSGRPVKVLWTREEDIQHDFYRPAIRASLRAGLDVDGRPVAWANRIAAPSIWARVNPGQMKDGVDSAAVEGVVDTPYRIPNFRVEYVQVDLPIPVGFWRSVGNSHNGFVMECFVDELAHAAGRDPLEFRLSLLPDGSRSRRVLNLVAEKSGWGKPLAKGQARGVAQHLSFGSAVAEVVEASVDKETGRITVHRMVCAVDCGPAVNPDTVKGQIMGGAVMGLSAALKEKVEFSKGGVTSGNLDDYDLLRMGEAPDVEVSIVSSRDAIGGVGEPGLPPAAPALANAVFAATGARLRTLPLSPAAVRAALKG